MGIGNTLRGDDGIGSIIAKNFKDNDWLSLDCGVAPENFTSVIKKNKPHLVVLIDVVEMDLKPGEFRIIDPEKISIMHLTTHSIPLSFLISYLENFTPEVIFIGIQPKLIYYSTSISPEIFKSSEEIIKILKDKKINLIKKL
ncbi:MAG: hydrogenase maturation peptidase HycI [Candidatus Atribacteria bacterium]|nr:hydrogenase maturation peptidase HycI [Candidatus Atribacteria bacterium]